MAKINKNKKVINLWDGGIKTSNRSNNPKTSDGCQMIKGFDVYKDPKKLIPMQSWQDFTLESEKSYGIRAIGGQSDTIYGVGTAITNWYGRDWSYRILITANTSLRTATGLPLWLNMALLPNDFWANVNSDMSDIRIADTTGTVYAVHTENVDTSAKTGDMWIQGSVPSTFYIYYGNPNTEAIPYGVPSINYTNGARNVFSGNSMRWAYNFGDENVGNRYYSSGDVGATEAFTTKPNVFGNGLIGKYIQTSGITLTTDTDDEVSLTNSRVSLSFIIKMNTASGVYFYEDGNNTFNVSTSSARKIVFNFSASSGSTVCTSTTALTLGSWYVIDIVFDNDAYIYINGVKETFSISDGNFSAIPQDNTVLLNTLNSNDISISHIWAFNTNLSDAQSVTKYNNFTNASFWTIGSQTTFTSIVPQYGGVQVYYKLISSGNWKELLSSGRPVKNLSSYPVNGFVDDTGTYFIVSQEQENQGFLYMAMVDPFTILDTTHLLLSVLGTNSSKIAIQSENAQYDNTNYFNFGTSAIGSIGDPGSSSEFTFAGIVQSLASWRSYLASAYTIRNRARVDIWDLASSIIERLDAGTGNIRIVGNAGDTLFCVVDNFIDDAIKSANKPTMEVRKYIGNGQTEKTHVLEIPAIIDDSTYTDNWERAVSNFKLQRNKQTLFYARLPKDSTGTTFDEGFWAVGKNSRGELCLTLQIDTEGLGMPEQVFGFAQQIFFVQKDGGIKRLSDNTYSNTSLFKSLKMNEGNTQIEKKLHGFEIITEPLEENQIISLYYKINGDSNRTKIGTMLGEGEISKELLYDENGESLRNYKEIELEVESTGGKSSILEVNYKYQYLNDII